MSVGAMVSYFLVAVWWPDLRDSGVLNCVLGCLGLPIGFWAAARSFRQRRWRVTSSLILFLGTLSTLFLVVYLFYLSYQLPPTENVITTGSAAPEFNLKDQQGRVRSLAEFSGRKVLLVFFRGHW